MKKIPAIGNRIPSNMFDYSTMNGSFSADISMLSHCRLNVLDQLYHDACDEGFVMVSAKTGDEVDFYLDFTSREADGDIRFYIFKPSARAIEYNKKLAFVKVTVYNT